MNTPDKKTGYALTLKTAPLAVFGAAFLLVIVQCLFQSGPKDARPFMQLVYPMVLLLNLLPLLLVTGTIFFLTRRLWIAVLVTALPFALALYTNHYKIMYRQEPFNPGDLALAAEATNITEGYSLAPDLWVILGILLVLVTVVCAAIFFRPAAIGWKRRLISAALCLVLLCPLSLCYKDKTVYDRVSAWGESFNAVSSSSGKGFLFTFLTDISAVHYDKPEGYSPEAARKILSRYATAGALDPEKTPNVIAIMSEAFFDVSEAENLEFLPGQDPLTGYKKILAQSYHGKIVVPGFAGGTAATESEFLTGINTSMVSTAMPVIYTSYLKRKTYGLPMLFRQSEYVCDAIHPGHPWFYNRQNVYPCLGFESFTTKDDLPDDVEQVHYYVSDRVTTDMIIEHYEEYLNDPQKDGYFNFTVTIQNHGPYAEEIVGREPRLVRPEGVSDELYAVMDNYMEGLNDADRMLLRLTNYLNSVDEPTVLVFFGDHLPYFDADFEGLNALGYDMNPETKEGMLRRYQTPYLIWQNRAARKNSAVNRTGAGPTISANFLSTLLLEQMQVPLPPYFAFLKELREKVQVISPTYYIRDGVMTHEVDAETEQLLKEYRILQYYHLFDYGK